MNMHTASAGGFWISPDYVPPRSYNPPSCERPHDSDLTRIRDVIPFSEPEGSAVIRTHDPNTVAIVEKIDGATVTTWFYREKPISEITEFLTADGDRIRTIKTL